MSLQTRDSAGGELTIVAAAFRLRGDVGARPAGDVARVDRAGVAVVAVPVRLAGLVGHGAGGGLDALPPGRDVLPHGEGHAARVEGEIPEPGGVDPAAEVRARPLVPVAPEGHCDVPLVISLALYGRIRCFAVCFART